MISYNIKYFLRGFSFMTLDTIIKNAASALAADYNASEISVSEENGRLPSKDEIIKILKNIQRVIK